VLFSLKAQKVLSLFTITCSLSRSESFRELYSDQKWWSSVIHYFSSLKRPLIKPNKKLETRKSNCLSFTITLFWWFLQSQNQALSDVWFHQGLKRYQGTYYAKTFFPLKIRLLKIMCGTETRDTEHNKKKFNLYRLLWYDYDGGMQENNGECLLSTRGFFSCKTITKNARHYFKSFFKLYHLIILHLRVTTRTHVCYYATKTRSF